MKFINSLLATIGFLIVGFVLFVLIRYIALVFAAYPAISYYLVGAMFVGCVWTIVHTAMHGTPDKEG